MSPIELARKAGVTDATIYNLIGKPRASKQTRVMEEIHRALEWPEPQDAYGGPTDIRRAKFARKYEQLTDDDRAKIDEMIDLYLTKRGK